MSITVLVPASSANLGPGFDCLGLALQLENRFTLAEATEPSISVAGEGATVLDRSPRNLAYRAAVRGYELEGKKAPAFALDLTNAIPLSRGLGSSSAAIVGGLLAGAALAGVEMTPERLVIEAARMEGHPDNVAPAVFGGLTVAVMEGDEARVAQVPLPPSLSALVFVPDTTLETRQARAILPASVPRADAVFNVGRAALLVAAMATGRIDLLSLAGEDRLHQPYRENLVPGMAPILAAAAKAGAALVALSGAGPSLLALVDGDGEKVREAMEAAANGIPGRVRDLPVAVSGARILPA